MAAGQTGPIAIGHLANTIRQSGDKVKTSEALITIANASNAQLALIASLRDELLTAIEDIDITGTGLTLADLITLGFRRSLILQVDLVLGVNLIEFDDPVYDGDSLSIWIRQNAGGTGTVDFDTNLLFADPFYVTNEPDLVTIYPFVAFPDPDDGDILKWFCVSPPNAGQTI